MLLGALGWITFATSCQPATTSSADEPRQARAVPRVARAQSAAPKAIDSVADGRLLAVRQLVRRLDAQPRRAWSRVRRADLFESAEGGAAVYYYLKGRLRKITAQYLGETGQQRTVFYLLSNGQLAFVRESTYFYNRPITYDSAAMRENQDTEAFDLKKSTSTSTRSYFDHGRLRYQAGEVPADSVAVPAYQLREQRRLWAQLRQLRALAAGQ